MALKKGDAVPTVIFYAKSFPSWKRVLVESLRHITGWRLESVPAPLQKYQFVKRFFANNYDGLSYTSDWLDAFVRNPSLSVTLCDINNPFDVGRILKNLSRFSLLIVLHSAAGDTLWTMTRLAKPLQSRKGRLVLFVGNESYLMDEKIQFAQLVQADFIGSALSEKSAKKIYKRCSHASVILAPSALNPVEFTPGDVSRPIDVGFRGQLYSYAIGDVERTQCLLRVREAALRMGLREDIAYVGVGRRAWADFLRRTNGVPGAESGTYFLEWDSNILRKATEYCLARPTASWEEVSERFFRDRGGCVDGKTVSSRHFEPIGTKSCQLLLEGHYNGMLQPHIHYIPIKKDLSDVEEALRQFMDPEVRHRITERAYLDVMQYHTYEQRVKDVLKKVVGSL